MFTDTFKISAPENCCLDGLTSTEVIDIKILDKLISSTLLVETFNNQVVGKAYDNERNHLLAIRKNLKKTKKKDAINYTHELKVKYNKVRSLVYGRVFVNHSIGLFACRREIRQTLTKNNYIDIDIKNCFPVLIDNIIKQNGITSEYINKYVENRDKYLTEVMLYYDVDYETAKKFFLIVSHGGSFNTWKDKIPNFDKNKKIMEFMKGYYEELQDFMTYVYNANPDLVEQVKKRKDEIGKDFKYNPKGSVCGYFLQEIECQILTSIYAFCLEKGYIKDNDMILCYDGLMLRKEKFNPNCIQEFNELVKQKFGLELNFEVKEMKQDYLQILDENQIKVTEEQAPQKEEKEEGETKEERESIEDEPDIDETWDRLYKSSHKTWAEFYYKRNRDKYIYLNAKGSGWYSYNENNILIEWTKNAPDGLIRDLSEQLVDWLKSIENETPYPLEGDEEEKERWIEKMKFLKSLYRNFENKSYLNSIIEMLSDYYANSKILDLMDDNQNVIAFNNLLFDYSIKDFREIRPSDYISKTTKYSINTQTNPEIRKELDNLLISIFGTEELKKYFLETTSLSLFTNRFESLYIHTGIGGNGKGVLSSLIQSALGNYFYLAPNTFLTSNQRDGAPNPTLANCKGVRYLLITEPEGQVGEDTSYFNEEFLKRITGERTVTTRGLYKDEISYKCFFTPHLQCNKVPKIKKLGGMKRRINNIPYQYEFVDKPDSSKPYQKKKDTTLKDKFEKKEYINEFMLLLLDTVKNFKGNTIIQPEEVKEKTDEYIGENDPVKFWLQINFDIGEKVDKEGVKRKIPIKNERGDNVNKYSMKELKIKYKNDEKDEFMSDDRFKDLLVNNGCVFKKICNVNYVVGIIEKTEDEKKAKRKELGLEPKEEDLLVIQV
jgi:phage/plasmid-associated DNA primase